MHAISRMWVKPYKIKNLPKVNKIKCCGLGYAIMACTVTILKNLPLYRDTKSLISNYF